MTLDQAKGHFRTYTGIADALGITKGAITQWEGKIPEKWQIELHKLTKGAIKADASILAKYRELLKAA